MTKRKISPQEFIFQAAMIILFSMMFLVCFYPFYYVFIVSISDPKIAVGSAIHWLPIGCTLENFKKIFELDGIFRAFLVSVARTVIGTIVTIIFTSILAFTLIQKELPMKKFFYRFSVISMYINAGLIPWYLTLRSLHLKDSFLVYILPSAVSAYCLVLIKTYMESIPEALSESARIDGAGYFTIYLKIIMPMCIPILAAVIVFTAVGQWNSWTDNLLLVSDNSLRTLQLTLMEYLNQAANIAQQAQNGGVVEGAALTPFTIKMTITMVVTLPIILVYPFMQKYFIQGIMIGAVKG